MGIELGVIPVSVPVFIANEGDEFNRSDGSNRVVTIILAYFGSKRR